MTDKTCSECRTVFDCAAGGSTGCWCNDFPPVMAPDPSLSCVCPSCLAKTLRQRIRETCDTLDRTACLALARPYRDRKPLIEHLDYYLEDGNWVFTEWFHWKRGQCCGNACRHCPYSHEAVPES
ncbi:DUF5522 domain-containing protein [Saccharospirillum salsuginis]|uniref:Cysteine-rich CWC n=1 Tax=Saccharospirillum salsuginis TaxID=418750 RepID=A0A918KDL2_9GAMM|nr:DUF5522 domain-containing protein [Saccharospirillum salsuginis]GGX58590.1 hypothetical protein GCM10007392_28130 [Saccharospirillum salsuginis]